MKQKNSIAIIFYHLACQHCGEDLWVFIEPDGNVEAIAARDMPNDDDREETDDLEHWGQPDLDPWRRGGRAFP